MFFFIAPFLVSSSHETFVKENRWFFGGGIEASVLVAAGAHPGY